MVNVLVIFFNQLSNDITFTFLHAELAVINLHTLMKFN